LSLNENVTLDAKRYIVWLLVAALVAFIAWVVGYTSEKLKLHYAFQANTYRHRRVLSFFFLGCQVIRKKIDLHIEIRRYSTKSLGDPHMNQKVRIFQTVKPSICGLYRSSFKLNSLYINIIKLYIFDTNERIWFNIGLFVQFMWIKLCIVKIFPHTNYQILML
jgi:hypothetical protein